MNPHAPGALLVLPQDDALIGRRVRLREFPDAGEGVVIGRDETHGYEVEWVTGRRAALLGGSRARTLTFFDELEVVS